MDVSPTYYNPSTPNTKDVLSFSKVGSASMQSKIDRFPIQHDHWGYPDSGHYEPMQSFRQQAQKQAATIESAAFKSITRDNYFYQEPTTVTPDPGTYDINRNAAYKLAQIRNQKRQYEKAKDKSTTQQLMREAAAHHKSLSKYLIESDPNFVPPPPLFDQDKVLKQNSDVYGEMRQQSPGAKQTTKLHKYTKSDVNKLQNQYNLDVQRREIILAKEIQQEIDQTKNFYDSLQTQKPEIVQQLDNQQLVQIVKQNFNKSLAEGGIAFQSRTIPITKEAAQVLQEKQECVEYLAPNMYKVNTEKSEISVVPIGKQLGRGEGEIKKTPIPGVGTYDAKLADQKQSFIVNDDGKFIQWM